ncbi:hypothetical protein ACFSC4_04185 [Deinococcus malanensis]|uniref:hypothetical protein n=1 Tax=Deinococcus malanensis TaxID=1706855 RepID=UPI003631622F
MKKLSGSWPWVLTLPLLLAACTENYTTPVVDPPVVQPPAPQPPGGPVPTTLNLGHAVSAPVHTAYSGSWQVIGQPEWLAVTPLPAQVRSNSRLPLTAARAPPGSGSGQTDRHHHA